LIEIQEEFGKGHCTYAETSEINVTYDFEITVSRFETNYINYGKNFKMVIFFF